LDELEARHGLAISYEDPIYPDEPGFAEAILDTAQSAEPSCGTHRVPKPRSLSFSYAATDVANAGLLIERLLQAAADGDRSGSPLSFRLTSKAGVYAVSPAAAPAETGNQRSISPLVARGVLDTPVDLPAQARNGLELLTEVAIQITRLTGVSVDLGMIPSHVLARLSSTLEAVHEPAREVLARGLASLGFGIDGRPRLVWRLFYDPEFQFYALNLHFVSTSTTRF
jgi:hypothetical protein